MDPGLLCLVPAGWKAIGQTFPRDPASQPGSRSFWSGLVLPGKSRGSSGVKEVGGMGSLEAPV